MFANQFGSCHRLPLLIPLHLGIYFEDNFHNMENTFCSVSAIRFRPIQRSSIIRSCIALMFSLGDTGTGTTSCGRCSSFTSLPSLLNSAVQFFIVAYEVNSLSVYPAYRHKFLFRTNLKKEVLYHRFGLNFIKRP